MIVRLTDVRCWVSSPTIGGRFYLPAIFTYQYLLGAARGKLGFYASPTVSIAVPKSLSMKILGQNGCFFKLHGIWYLTKT